MELWLESSINDLYQSAVQAFPNTTKRQYATDTIQISSLNWVPFVGFKTLFVKAIAQNEGKEYNPIILFKGVVYHEAAGPNIIGLDASDGQHYFLERLSLNAQNVMVRCPCKDFFWRMHHYNHEDKSLQGKDRKKYEAIYNPGSANPQELPGLCKHLMKFAKVLNQSGLIT
jgi:hypothetical protein